MHLATGVDLFLLSLPELHSATPDLQPTAPESSCLCSLGSMQPPARFDPAPEKHMATPGH